MSAFWFGLLLAAAVNSSKADVYLDSELSAGLADGNYVFQVTDPSGKRLLSNDAARCRQFTVSGGKVTGVFAQADKCHHATAADPAAKSVKVRLAPFDNTPNPGGVYKVWVSPQADFLAGCRALGVNTPMRVVNCGQGPGNQHGFVHAHAKTQTFKVRN